MGLTETMSTLLPCFRSFNGCKIPLNSLPSEILLNGKKNVMLRDNLIVHCPILVPATLENCLEKPLGYIPVWNVLTIILGFWILPAMDSRSNNSQKQSNNLIISSSILSAL